MNFIIAQGLAGVAICAVSFILGIDYADRALMSKKKEDQDRWGMCVVGCAVLFWIGVIIWVLALIFWRMSKWI